MAERSVMSFIIIELTRNEVDNEINENCAIYFGVIVITNFFFGIFISLFRMIYARRFNFV